MHYFFKNTHALMVAYNGYCAVQYLTVAFLSIQECIESMSYDHTWFKELDGVYSEIWLRVTQGLVSTLHNVHHASAQLKNYLMVVRCFYKYCMSLAMHDFSLE